MADDVRVTFNQAIAATKELIATLDLAIERGQALGNEQSVARLRATRAAIAAPITATSREAPQIAADTQALRDENAVRSQGLAIEQQKLRVMREQAVQAERLGVVVAQEAAAAATVARRAPVTLTPEMRAFINDKKIARQNTFTEKDSQYSRYLEIMGRPPGPDLPSGLTGTSGRSTFSFEDTDAGRALFTKYSKALNDGASGRSPRPTDEQVFRKTKFAKFDGSALQATMYAQIMEEQRQAQGAAIEAQKAVTQAAVQEAPVARELAAAKVKLTQAQRKQLEYLAVEGNTRSFGSKKSLYDLESRGLVEKAPGYYGSKAQITDAGRAALGDATVQEVARKRLTQAETAAVPATQRLAAVSTELVVQGRRQVAVLDELVNAELAATRASDRLAVSEGRRQLALGRGGGGLVPPRPPTATGGAFDDEQRQLGRARELALQDELLTGRAYNPIPPGQRQLGPGPVQGQLGSGEATRQAQEAAANEERMARAAAATAAEEKRVTDELARQRVLRAQMLEQARLASQQYGAVASQGRAQGRPESPLGRGQRIDEPVLPDFEAAGAGSKITGSEQAFIRGGAAVGRYTTLSREGAETSHVFGSELTRLGLLQNEASNQMRKHGALTTEFISALARGETTIGEFGYQISATIGKFAGWTAAAALTYGALAAVTAIGKGAIDSASGVQQLHRTINNVDSTRAQQQFRDLSTSANVSIKDAADAVFQFSRTFHDQDTAVGTARLGLQALTLDNVKVADSVKLATALHQHYHDTLLDLTGVSDVLAAGQREYNARISETIPLLAASVGALQNQGTAQNDALQIAIYAQRVTQASGSQLATALGRSAQTFVKKAGATAVFDALGLPSKEAVTNYGQFLKDAIQRSLTLDNKQRSELSTAFGGAQLGARIFSRLFSGGDQKLIDEILGPNSKLTPQGTKGSADEEQRQRLLQADQQLSAIGHNLQRLGSALSEAGAPLGSAVVGLNNFLKIVTQAAQVFGSASQPVKLLIEAVLALAAASALARKTQIGASINELAQRYGVPGANSALFKPSEADAFRTQQKIGTRSGLDLVNLELESATGGAARLQAQANIMQRELAALSAELESGALQGEAANAAFVRINELDSQINASRQRLAETEGRIVAIQEERVALQERLTALSTTDKELRLTNKDLIAEQVVLAQATALAEGQVLIAEEEVAVGMRARLLALRGQAGLAAGAIPGALAKAGFAALITDTVAQTIGQYVPGQLGKDIGGAGKFAAAGAAIGTLAPVPFGPIIGALLGEAIGLTKPVVDRAFAQLIPDTPPPAAKAGFDHAFGSLFDSLQHRITDASRGDLSLIQIRDFHKQLQAMAKDPAYAEFAGSLSRLDRELTHVTASTERQALAAQRHRELLGTGEDAKTSTAQIDSLSNRASGLGVTQADLSGIAQRTLNLSQNLGNRTTLVATLKAIKNGETKYVDTIKTGAQRLVDAAALDSTVAGQEARLNGITALFAQAATTQQKGLAILSANLKTNRDKLRRAEQEQESAPPAFTATGAFDPQGGAIGRRIAALRALVARQSKALGDASSTVKETQLQLDLLQKQLRDQAIQAALTIQDSIGALKVSQIPGIGPAADQARQRAAIGNLQADLGLLERDHADPTKIRDQQTKINDAQRALLQSQTQQASTLHQQIAAYIQARAAYQQSQTLDPTTQAREQLAADQQSLALIQRGDFQTQREFQTARLQGLTKVNTDRTTVQNDIVQNRLSQLGFEAHTQQIGDQQYISGLQRILRTSRLSADQQRQIRSQIFDLQHANSSTPDLNIGNIHIPSIYEIRAAISRSQSGVIPGQSSTVVNHDATVNVYVNNARDVHKVGKAIDDQLGTSVRAAVRARGLF